MAIWADSGSAHAGEFGLTSEPESNEKTQLRDACYEDATTIKAAEPRRKTKRPYLKHGLVTLKQAVKGLGGRVIDKRTTLGKSLGRWRTDLIRDIGGPDVVSTQQVAVVDLAVKSKLLLDSIDSWLLKQPTLVNARKRSLLPAVKERQSLADGLAKYMAMLGLERRQKDVLDPSRQEMLRQEIEAEREEREWQNADMHMDSSTSTTAERGEVGGNGDSNGNDHAES